MSQYGAARLFIEARRLGGRPRCLLDEPFAFDPAAWRRWARAEGPPEPSSGRVVETLDLPTLVPVPGRVRLRR